MKQAADEVLANINNIDDIIRKFPRVVSSEVISPALNEQQLRPVNSLPFYDNF